MNKAERTALRQVIKKQRRRFYSVTGESPRNDRMKYQEVTVLIYQVLSEVCGWSDAGIRDYLSNIDAEIESEGTLIPSAKV